MRSLLRIAAFILLSALIFWGCSPLTATIAPITNLTSRNAQTPTDPASVTSTEIIEFSPALPEIAQPGVCPAPSVRVARTNVWQCTVNNKLYDPCFSIGANADVVCIESPLDTSSAFKVELMSPLRLKSTNNAALPLAIDSLSNLWYFGIDVVEGPVLLEHGEYHLRDSNGSLAEEVVVRLSEIQAQGDLDQDGDSDAATLLVANAGGVFIRYYLAVVINQDGAAQNAATVVLGDGIQIDNISVEGGQIIVDLITHGAQDPLCCPTVSESRFYNLLGNQLVLYTNGWHVELADGVHCSLTANPGEQLTYLCSDGRNLLGNLQPGPIWSVQRLKSNIPSASISPGDVETVNIRRVWQ